MTVGTCCRFGGRIHGSVRTGSGGGGCGVGVEGNFVVGRGRWRLGGVEIGSLVLLNLNQWLMCGGERRGL